ncbi:ubiquitin-like modifier-activating enzyme ATG7 isoform X1 [Lineus longissimus]|uniref:ubiquitin-like modifier-activating enzyme ATG7 isoform X1 n=1 Tax=Lineus longissimus TaxID=88925 RepID=UPI00315DF594
MSTPCRLQFVPFSSALDAGFWHLLSRNKLDVYKLDETTHNIHGFYYNGDPPGLPCRMNIDYTAFEEAVKTPPRCYRTNGKLLNTNTLDSFREFDKKAFLESSAKLLWEDIRSGRAIEDPGLLSRFILLTFADLKKYHYFYWFAFPALTIPDAVKVTAQSVSLEERFNQKKIEDIKNMHDQMRVDSDASYFLLTEDRENVKIAPLKEYKSLAASGKKPVLCFCDPCTLEKHPGWPLRNLLTLAAYNWSSADNEFEVICYRDRMKDGLRSTVHSIVFKVKLMPLGDLKDCPKCVGWEKNENQSLGPRKVNLSATMDPSRLAESSVDLNLKLMRWRLMPELDLENISSTKCLLLGSGTLGCNVARNLMGWGVRTITLVDNGRISYSNPVRQSLFTFDDCLHGGKPKAQAAAESLKKIFPGLNATGITLSIPMPGHIVSESLLNQVKKDVARLEELVDNHDVLFLLMDTRESRWLPTLLGMVKRKLVINAALGFDTFLVVRHGLRHEDGTMDTLEDGATMRTPIHGSQLGCYFCNDVVAPGDSTHDRTLDQQCTVSRPGMSMLASALAVELLMSVLQHPEGGYAAADTSAKDEHFIKEPASSLGLVPHQIRGFLSRFDHVLPCTRAYDRCTACSQVVCQEYLQHGFEFLLKAFNSPSYLEDLTGLTKLHLDTQDIEIWDLSDDESISD